MFFQPPGKDNNSVKSAGAQKSARRKRRKLEQKLKNKKQLLRKEKQRFANSMSSWAQNFTMAVSWQQKHEIAHWKARAKALEYENNILRSTLRRCYVKGIFPKSTENSDDEEDGNGNREESEEGEEEDAEEEEADPEEMEEDDSDENNEEDDDGTLVVSEEFLEFLKNNAEFRKARDERKRQEKLEEEMPMRLLESCPADPIDQEAHYKRLYGADWQKILALEMSTESQYISDCDKYKPVRWPGIPLRL